MEELNDSNNVVLFQMLSDIEKVEENGSSKMESIWREMQQTFVDYLAEISPMKPHYNALLNKDKINSFDLWQNRHTINKYIVIITNNVVIIN